MVVDNVLLKNLFLIRKLTFISLKNIEKGIKIASEVQYYTIIDYWGNIHQGDNWG